MCDEKEDRKRDKGWQEKVLIYLFLSEGSFLQETVCGAVLMAGAAKDVAGKVWAIFFPIFAFVVSGYEHCIANMYYIPMTLGNVIGGMVFMGALLYLVYK